MRIFLWFTEAISHPSGDSVLPPNHKILLLKKLTFYLLGSQRGRWCWTGGQWTVGRALKQKSYWCKHSGRIPKRRLIESFILTCGVVARTFCIKSLSFMLSIFSLTHSIFSLLRTLFFSFAETLLLLIFSLAQTDAEIDSSWLLWIGGAGGGTWGENGDEIKPSGKIRKRKFLRLGG